MKLVVYRITSFYNRISGKYGSFDIKLQAEERFIILSRPVASGLKETITINVTFEKKIKENKKFCDFFFYKYKNQK